MAGSTLSWQVSQRAVAGSLVLTVLSKCQLYTYQLPLNGHFTYTHLGLLLVVKVSMMGVTKNRR